ncbi:MAG: ABC transporter ATP-binding protein/permease [Candidatus Pacebacteria bacterium]|nr:ABC transporter ATP-binding protein/permease [Candidatus Paceibacterota bacterium]
MENKSKDSPMPISPIGFIWSLTRTHYLLLALILFSVFLTEILIVSAPVIIGKIIDTASNYAPGQESTFTQVGMLLALYVLLRFLASLVIRGTSVALHYLSKYIRTGAFKNLFSHLSLHSAAYFANRFAGSVSSDVSIVAQNCVKMNVFFVRGFLGVIFAIISSFVVIATASYYIAGLFIVGVLILIPINYLLSKNTVALAKKSAKTFSALRGYLVDSITNIETVQQFSRAKAEASRLDESIETYQVASIKSDVYTEKVLGINNVIVILLFVGGLLYSTFSLWAEGTISLGEFIMIVTLTGSLIKMLSHVGNMMNEFSAIYGEVKQALSQILTVHEVQDEIGAKQLQLADAEIQFKDVSFSYEAGSEVFDNFSCTIKPNERVGVVGPSGGGKTTFTKLLLRQYEISDGVITIGDNDIKSTTQDSLRLNIGIVPQESNLFHRSLFENIAYGKEGSTLEEVIEAAKKAQIHNFIDSLPNKYETVTGERGIKFSGGQKQRVAIARSILKNAPVLILDEATSSLDSESELAVQQGFKELMKGKTVVAIAHRLSTLKEMDRILVFKNGAIIQDGSHNELIREEDGLYVRLWKHQTDGFIHDDNE